MRSPFKSAKQVVGTTTVQAPTGGLNAYSPISNMPETDAVILRNFYPEPFGCRVRKGFREHATGFDGEVCSLMSYVPQYGATKILAVDQTKVWDISTPGALTAPKEVCTSGNPWWQSTNFANPAGTHMIAFNGVDNGICYSHDGLHRLVIGDGVAAYTWKNIDPKELVYPVVHQKRLWAVEIGSTKAWYLPPESIYGIAKSFDFGSNFARGGFLQALFVYTQDSGYGPDDYIGAVSSAGELCLYKGIDPEDASTWGLVGVFHVGSTFTRRCATTFGGDVALLTQYGMLTVNSLTKPDATSVLDNALSMKIQHLVSQSVSEGSYREGWSILLYPTANMVLINIPGIISSQTFQLVYCALTKAWTQFEGMQAVCWHVAHDSLLFGADGKVYRAWEGNMDQVPIDGEGGVSIRAEAQQAFSYFGLPGANKHFKMFRPTFVYSGKFKYRAAANIDFDFQTQPPPASFGTSEHGIWGSSIWDDTATWSGGSQSDKQWVSITGIGYTGSIRLAIETNSETLWVSTDWVMEKGGIV